MAVISAELWPGTVSARADVFLRALIRNTNGTPSHDSKVRAWVTTDSSTTELAITQDRGPWWDAQFRSVSDEQILHVEIEAHHPDAGVVSWNSPVIAASQERWDAWQKELSEIANDILAEDAQGEPARTLSDLMGDFAHDLWTRGRILAERDVVLPDSQDLNLSLPSLTASLLATRLSAVAHASFAATKYSVQVLGTVMEVEALGSPRMYLSFRDITARNLRPPWNIQSDALEGGILFRFPIEGSDETPLRSDEGVPPSHDGPSPEKVEDEGREERPVQQAKGRRYRNKGDDLSNAGAEQT